MAFEKILKIVPNNYETLSVLGSLYTFIEHRDQNKLSQNTQNGIQKGNNLIDNKPKADKAREVLKKVVEMCSDDIEVLIELAQLQEQNDPQVNIRD